MRGTRLSWPSPLRAQGTVPALGIGSVELAGPDSSLLCGSLPRASGCVDVAGDGWDLNVPVALPGPWLGCSSSKSQPWWAQSHVGTGGWGVPRCAPSPGSSRSPSERCLCLPGDAGGPGGGAAGLLLGHPALRLHSADGQQVSHAAPGMWLGAPDGGMSPDLGQPHAGTCGSLCPFPCWAPWASLGQGSAGVSPNPVPISPSFERLLLHALCQYMDLVSASKSLAFVFIFVFVFPLRCYLPSPARPLPPFLPRPTSRCGSQITAGAGLCPPMGGCCMGDIGCMQQAVRGRGGAGAGLGGAG